MSLRRAMMNSFGFNFELSQVSGLQVHYDMTDNSTISQSGGVLTQLRDKSGNNNHSNPTSTQRGTISTDASTGKQVLVINGTSNKLPLTTELSFSGDFSLFFVLKNTDTASIRILGSASSGSDYVAIYNKIPTVFTQGTSTTHSCLADESTKILSVFSVRRTGSLITMEQNGRRLIPAANPANTGVLRIGQLLMGNGGFYVPGEFAGFAAYNTYVSDDNLLNIVKKLFLTHNLSPSYPGGKIIGYGDSITNAVGASSTANGWLTKVAVALGKIACSAAINGTPFQNTGSAPNNGYDRYSKQLIEYNYRDRLYISYGTNDITGVSTGGTVAIFQTQLDLMIRDLISRGYIAANIRLGTPGFRQHNADAALNTAYGNAVKAVGATYGIPVADLYTAMLNGGGNTLMNDSVHPNDAGHQLIADTFLALG